MAQKLIVKRTSKETALIVLYGKIQKLNWGQREEVEHMKTQGMTAEVFLTAFKAMPKKEQNIFLSKIVKDSRLREDLIDIAIAENRAKDGGRSFREFLKDSGE